MQEDLAVTVLMTVYNGSRFLAEAIRSILVQRFRDYEFLIIDDASNDGSVSVLKDFAAKDARIRLILNEQNKGQTACLNQGIHEARGVWIARQDADDVSLTGRLQSQWDVVRKNPSLAIVGVNGWVINEQGATAGMIHAPLTDGGIRWSMPFCNPFIHTGVMFRRQWPDGSPVLYNEEFRICQDWELWGRVLTRGSGTNLPQRLVAYRHHEGSLSHGNQEITQREMKIIARHYFQANFPNVSFQSTDEVLLYEFQNGLTDINRRKVWIFYEKLKKEWPGKNISQAVAVHHFQAAGSTGLKAPTSLLKEMYYAFQAAPGWTSKTVLRRISGL